MIPFPLWPQFRAAEFVRVLQANYRRGRTRIWHGVALDRLADSSARAQVADHWPVIDPFERLKIGDAAEGPCAIEVDKPALA